MNTTNNVVTQNLPNTLIVGGGIGGLCAAIALQQIGIAVKVYEQSSAIRDLGAGLVIWPNALSALDVLGIGDKVRALSVEDIGLGGILTWRGHRLLSMSNRDMTSHFGTSAIVVHRAELYALLTQELQPGTLHLGARCTGFIQTANQVTARFEDGSQASASMLIGADGLRSATRQQIAPNNPLRYSGYTAWRSVTPFDHNRIDQWGEFWGNGTRFGITPVSHNRVYWFCTENVPEGESRKASAEERKAHLLDLFKGWVSPIPALLLETDAASILNNDISDLTPLSHWSDGRVSLLGDAAHAMTPNLGQGACQAIEDAVVLGHCLKKYMDVPEALKAYEQARVLRATQIVIMSRNIGAVGQWESPLACSIRNFAVSIAPTSIRLNSLKPILTFALQWRTNLT